MTVASTDYRNKLHRIMHETLTDEERYHDWTYRAVRPEAMPPRPWRSGERIVGDCSKGVQYLCWWANSPHDPMGMHYGPFGNSETLTLKLQHLDRISQLKVGDIVTFGVRGEKHAAMVMGEGSDPLLWSFGHQGAPNQYRLSQDPREHHLLRNPLPRYVPTADDKLRAKTGYWAWLQWKLGEGDWHHHKPSDKSVRPHVPLVIPPHWWVRYAQFLANRDKANTIQRATPIALQEAS